MNVQLSLFLFSFHKRRDGLMKMKSVYEQNTNMGDPHSVEGQLQENAVKMEKLQSELKKFVSWLAEADGKPTTPNVQRKNLSPSNRNSVSESDSLSRSASDSSVGVNPNNTATSNNCQLTPKSTNSRLDINNSDTKSIKSGVSGSTPEIETNGLVIADQRF